MKNRWTLFPKLLCLFPLVILAACANSPATLSARVPVSTTNNPIALTVWHTQTGGAAKSIDALINDFHKEYPSIAVRAEQKPNEVGLLKEGLARIAMNDTPDLVIADSRTLAEFARRNALVNIDPLITDAKDGLREDERNDFFPGMLDAGRLPDLKNQLLVFPFDQRAIILYYNADALQAAKSDIPRTWDEFNTIARVTTRGDARGWVMSPSAAVFASFLVSRGSGVLNATQTQAQLNDDAGTKSLDLIAALTKSGAAYLANDAASARNDFARGNAILLFDATNELTSIADAVARGAKFKWGVANIPQNDPSRPVTTMLGNGISIFRTTKEHERAAWLFARWLTMPEQSARWSRETLSLPVRVSARNFLASNLPTQLQRLRDGFGDALPLMRPMPVVKDAGLIDSAVVEMWTNVANGMDPSTAMKNAIARVNRILGVIQ